MTKSETNLKQQFSQQPRHQQVNKFVKNQTKSSQIKTKSTPSCQLSTRLASSTISNRFTKSTNHRSSITGSQPRQRSPPPNSITAHKSTSRSGGVKRLRHSLTQRSEASVRTEAKRKSVEL